ncbi:DinB family protein [Deinococcus yavapaiensis]|nr:DinB family protein [Deinococcus yavapaiensis]
MLHLTDNAVHHRAQGHESLRPLGIEPPPFYERG